MGLNLGPYGLGLAQSTVSILEVIVLLFIMNRRIKGLIDRPLINAVGRMAGATALMSIVCYTMVQLFQLQNADNSFLATFPKFVLIVVVSIGTYLLFSRVLHLKEADPILSRVNQVLFARAGSSR